MVTIFDSSALIAAFVESHPKHKAAFTWLKQAKSKEFRYVVASHSIAEVYSVLTSAPFKPRISTSAARKLIEENITSDAKIISLSGQDYFQVIERMDQLGLKGGIVYDALVVECARKSKSKEILTSNTKDFIRLLPDDSIRIITL